MAKLDLFGGAKTYKQDILKGYLRGITGIHELDEEVKNIWNDPLAFFAGSNPSPPQMKMYQYLQNPTIHTVVYGGAVGGGKSHAGTRAALRYAIQHPYAVIWVVMTDVEAAKRVLLDHFNSALGWLKEHRGLEYKWENTKDIYSLKTDVGNPEEYSAQIRLIAASKPKGWWGGQCDFLWVDELQEVTESAFSRLLTRWRGSAEGSKRGYRKKKLLTANPGGILVNRYWKPHRAGLFGEGAEDIEDKHKRELYRATRFVEADMKDNPLYGAEAQKQMLAETGDEKMRDAILGIWDTVKGRAYSAFDEDRHVMDYQIEQVTGLPYNQIDWMIGYDWALNHNSAAMVGAVANETKTDEHGTIHTTPILFIWDEYVVKTRDIADYCQWFLNYQKHRLYVDPTLGQQVANRNKVQVNLMEELRRWDLKPIRADMDAARSRLQGVQLINGWIKRGQVIIHPRCVKLIEALNCHSFRQESRTGEYSDKYFDEAFSDECDAFRYLAINCQSQMRTDAPPIEREKIEKKIELQSAKPDSEMLPKQYAIKQKPRNRSGIGRGYK